MNNFTFCRGTDYRFGRGVEKDVGKVCKEHGISRVLLHFGGHSAEKSGLLNTVRKSLEQENILFYELGGVQPNPRAELVYEGIKLARAQHLELILAVGGGSVIDSAKAIAMGVPYPHDFWDFFMGNKVPREALPVGCIVTIAASGSEGSDSCVINKTIDGIIKKKGSNFKTSIPMFSLLNPELTMSLPPYQTACGACDIMTHVMERYFTNTKDTLITDEICEGILRTVVAMLPKVMEDPYDYEARAAIMWAGTLAHNNIAGVGREQDWASHRIEMELSALYDVAHGAGLSVVMPAWMDYVLDHDVMRFVRFANKVFDIEVDPDNPRKTAKEGIEALRLLWHKAGLPLNFEELGAKREDIPKLVANHGRKTEGHFVELGSDDIQKIFEIAADYRPE